MQTLYFTKRLVALYFTVYRHHIKYICIHTKHFIGKDKNGGGSVDVCALYYYV